MRDDRRELTHPTKAPQPTWGRPERRLNDGRLLTREESLALIAEGTFDWNGTSCARRWSRSRSSSASTVIRRSRTSGSTMCRRSATVPFVLS